MGKNKIGTKTLDQLLDEAIKEVSPVTFNMVEKGAIKKAFERFLEGAEDCYAVGKDEHDLFKILIEDLKA